MADLYASSISSTVIAAFGIMTGKSSAVRSPNVSVSVDIEMLRKKKLESYYYIRDRKGERELCQTKQNSIFHIFELIGGVEQRSAFSKFM